MPTRTRKAPRSYAAIAERVVSRAVRSSFSEFFHMVAASHPKGDSRKAVRAFAAAVRAQGRRLAATR